MISTKQTVRCGLDVIGSRSKKEMTDVHKFTIIRIFIVFFIVVSGVITIFQRLASGSHLHCADDWRLMGRAGRSFLAPFLYWLYWKGISRKAVWVSFFWGCALAII